ncbi:hypothetical protein BGX34_003736 [Mortierella sp. NVP85]|nr:hypothetical protein BGX34_003736 [Mortierella sp. NVP85]
MDGTFIALCKSLSKPLPTKPVLKRARSNQSTSAKKVSTASKTIDEPWHNLMTEVMNIFKGDTQVPSFDDSTLSGYHGMIYNYAVNIASDPQALATSTTTQYDICVALSGIVNATMEAPKLYYDSVTLDRVKSLCRKQFFSDITKLHLLEDTLVPLRHAYSSGETPSLHMAVKKDEAMNMTMGTIPPLIQSVTSELISYLCQFKLPPLHDSPEFDFVSKWTHVLEIVTQHKLRFWSGELASTATKDQSAFLESALNAEMAAPYGRKLDLQLRAKSCSLLKDTMLELNNSEFKKHDTSPTDLAIQRRKNILVNHAMLVQLNTLINFPLDDVEVLFLDVRGWVANIFCLTKMDDVWACDVVCENPILLPYDTNSWEDFLKGPSIAMLWNYGQYLISYYNMVLKQDMQKLKEQHSNLCDTSDKTLSLGQFTFLPTKSRLKPAQ